MNDLLSALILGITEGATEFIPVSSTGHLILVGHVIGFEGSRAAVFEIVIQLGAILAVVWNSRAKLSQWIREAVTHHNDASGARTVLLNVITAFIPAAVVGLLTHHWITAHLFKPSVVGIALILGGLAILLVERFRPVPRTNEVTRISKRVALGIGLAQILSLVPGVSRAGATIMGGIALGVARPPATEFSFLLAIPVMFAATGVAGIESLSLLHANDALVFAVGFAAAFVSALIVIRWLLRFVAHHSFVGFAWYRVALGVLTLLVLRGPR